MGNAVQSAGTIPLPQYLQGFEAEVNGVTASLYYVSPDQVNLQIPYETQPGYATLTVGNPYDNVNYMIKVVAAAPGIFTDNGFVFPPFSSAARGVETALYITGEGEVSPSLADGASPSSGTPTSELPKPKLPVTVTVANLPATIDFIGIPPGLVGVTQINYVVPAAAPLGAQPVVVTVGGAASPAAMLTVTQ
jgi:adhesin/invasin